MDAEGKAEAASFFRRMAKLEDRHRAQIAERREQLFTGIAPTVRDVAAWGVEVADQARLKATLTQREALELALEAETRARDYYGEAVNYVTEPLVVELFEELRDAEIEHQRLLKLLLDKL